MADSTSSLDRTLGYGNRVLKLVQLYAPGLLTCAVIAIAAVFLSQQYRAPVLLFALLLGMAFHFLSQDGRCVAGIGFASKRVLRLGVALLGAQISLDQIISLGVLPIVTVFAGVVLTILVGVALARALGLETPLGILTGGAVAICGASAALAIGAALPRHDESERDTAFTVIGVTSLSTLAMILYPLLIPVFHLDHAAAGIFIGGTIHDVAQVVGAGFSISDETGNAATITKLFRVALLLPVVLAISLLYSRSSAAAGQRPRLLPGFLAGFAALVLLNSVLTLPAGLLLALKEVSRWCLIIAISALGMSTSIKAMLNVGKGAIVILVVETLFLAAFVLAAIHWAW